MTLWRASLQPAPLLRGGIHPIRPLTTPSSVKRLAASLYPAPGVAGQLAVRFWEVSGVNGVSETLVVLQDHHPHMRRGN
jgi:hypothetical protein